MRQGDVNFICQDRGHMEDDDLIQCPRCRSLHVDTRDYGKRTGGTIGCISGGCVGFSSALSGAELGMMAGTVAGPVGIFAGGIFGAVIGGLLGAAAGCAVGANVGEMVDETILDNYICLSCNYSFSMRS